MILATQLVQKSLQQLGLELFKHALRHLHSQMGIRLQTSDPKLATIASSAAFPAATVATFMPCGIWTLKKRPSGLFFYQLDCLLSTTESLYQGNLVGILQCEPQITDLHSIMKNFDVWTNLVLLVNKPKANASKLTVKIISQFIQSPTNSMHQ